MNKEEFLLVLQASLLAFDGVSIEELSSHYGINKKIAVAGFNLTQYLKSIDLKKKDLKGGEEKMKCEICLKQEGKKRSKYSGLFLCDKCLSEDKEHIKKSQEASKDLF